MPYLPVDRLPDSARIWIFGTSRPLEATESERLLDSVDEFLAAWNAHGHPVVGSRELRERRFLVIVADEEATGVSGCSIDALFRSLKAAEQELGVSLLDSSLVWFRDREGEVRSLSRPEFRELVARGEVGEDTPVFDNTVSTLGGLRGAEWERPMAESWHAQAFASRP